MPMIALADLAIKKGFRQTPFEDYEISMEETDRAIFKGQCGKANASKAKYELKNTSHFQLLYRAFFC